MVLSVGSSTRNFWRSLDSARPGLGATHNLELNRLSLELDGTNLEVDADGGDVGLGVRVVCESEEETRLADTGVTDEEEFEEVVVLASVHCVWGRVS